MEEILTTKSSKLDEFIDTKWYIAAVALFLFVMWSFKFETEGIILLGLILPIFITRKNGLTAAVVVISMIITGITLSDLPFNLPGNRFENVGNISSIIAVCFAVVTNVSAVIYHFIKYKPKAKSNFTYMIIPSLLVLIPVFLAGVGSGNYKFSQSLLIAAYMIYPAILAGLYSFSNMKNHKEYISWILIAVAFIIVLEMIVFYIKTDDILEAFNYKQIELNWGYSNSIAPMLSIGFFMAMYMFTTRGNIGYFLSAAVIAISMLFTFSRGCLIMFVLVAPISVICSIALSKKKLVPVLCISISFVVMIILLCICNDEIKKIFKYFIDTGFQESNRDIIRAAHLKGLEGNWLFGQAFIDLTKEATGSGIMTAHSTLVTVLSATGLFGAVFFGYYYLKKYLPLLATSSTYNIFASLAMVVFIGYALFDTTFYLVFQNLLVILLLEGANREYAERPEKHTKSKFIEYYKNDKIFLALTVLIGFALAMLGMSYARQTVFGVIFKKPIFDYVIYLFIFLCSLVTFIPAGERLIKMSYREIKKKVAEKKLKEKS